MGHGEVEQTNNRTFEHSKSELTAGPQDPDLQTFRPSDFQTYVSVDTVLIVTDVTLIGSIPDMFPDAYDAADRFDRIHQG